MAVANWTMLSLKTNNLQENRFALSQRLNVGNFQTKHCNGSVFVHTSTTPFYAHMSHITGRIKIARGEESVGGFYNDRPLVRKWEFLLLPIPHYKWITMRKVFQKMYEKSFFFPPGTLSMLLFRVSKGGGYHKGAVKKDTPLVPGFSCISKYLWNLHLASPPHLVFGRVTQSALTHHSSDQSAHSNHLHSQIHLRYHRFQSHPQTANRTSQLARHHREFPTRQSNSKMLLLCYKTKLQHQHRSRCYIRPKKKKSSSHHILLVLACRAGVILVGEYSLLSRWKLYSCHL